MFATSKNKKYYIEATEKLNSSLSEMEKIGIEIQKSHPLYNASFVGIFAKTGEIFFNYKSAQFDRENQFQPQDLKQQFQ